MSDVRALPQSVLQAPNVERLQDMQQRQASLDQRLVGKQFARKVDERQGKVQDAHRIELDALSGDANLGGDRGRQEGEEASEKGEEDPPHEPGLGDTIDLKA